MDWLKTSYWKKIFVTPMISFNDMNEEDNNLIGEEKLLIAVFFRAVNDVYGERSEERGDHKVGPHAKRTARQYFSPHREEIFSFTHLCNHFGFERDEVLKRLHSGKLLNILLNGEDL